MSAISAVDFPMTVHVVVFDSAPGILGFDVCATVRTEGGHRARVSDRESAPPLFVIAVPATGTCAAMGHPEHRTPHSQALGAQTLQASSNAIDRLSCGDGIISQSQCRQRGPFFFIRQEPKVDDLLVCTGSASPHGR